jgi:spore coat polysaccharide biosynthesis protein SpsF
VTEPSLGIVIFARMSSSRLPGKMLRPLGPTTLFDRVVERARLLDYELLLATSDQESDDPLVHRASELELSVFRGSLDDVLGRAVGAARHAGFEAFSRLCGDRPLMPLDDMKRGLELMRQSLVQGRPLDLVTTQLPEPAPKGLSTEIIRTGALEQLNAVASRPKEREHVTTGFYSAPSKYRIHALETHHRAFSDLSFAIDEPQDMDVIGRLIEQEPDPGLSVTQAARLIARHRSIHLEGRHEPARA